MKRLILLTCLLAISLQFGLGQITIDTKAERIGMSLQELYANGYISAKDLNSTKPVSNNNQVPESVAAGCNETYIPVDGTYTPVPRNDDGSLYIPNMGFTFSFCGTSYSDCFINTNGNVSFTQAVGQYSPDGFPYPTPMIAPFWADVDTRNTNCGQAWYKLFGNYMIVSWESVGWYNMQCSPLNTFQLIISDGTAGIIGIGNNIQFRYGDMEWTTGQASGGGPFGGFAATVGYNSGDNINFEQVGRFNVDGNSYDGPFGANDGVDWLDFNCFVFNAGTGSLSMICSDITVALDANCNAAITVEDVAEVFINGCLTAEVTIDITEFGCDNIGANTVTITADAGGTVETCTAVVTIVEGACSVPMINPVGPFCDTDSPVLLTPNLPGGTWGGAANPDGTFDPVSNGQGIHTVTYTTPNGCPQSVSMSIEVYQSPEVTISPDPAEFCEEVGFIDIMANGTGGDGNYTYSWTTPNGQMTGSTIVGVSEGTYTVTITDGNGCEDISDLVVIMNPTPIITIIDPGIICEDEFFITMEAIPAGGLWSGTDIGPAGEVFPQSLGQGTYTFTYTYTDGFGCENAEVFYLEILAIPTVTVFNTGPYCEGATIELFSDTDFPNPVIYQWSGPAGYFSSDQNPIDATEEGIYYLQIISGDGCISEEVSTIVTFTESPDSDASNSGPYCPNDIIELFATTSSSGNITTFQWTGPNGYNSNQQFPVDATEDGFYSVVITVDGCESAVATTEVILAPAPDIIAFNSGPYCPNESIELFSSTNSSGSIITFQWTGPSGYTSTEQNPVDATEQGAYTVQVIVDGCGSQLEITNVILNQPTPPDISGNTAFCEGTSTSLDAGSGYVTYSWSNGSGIQTTNVSAAGSYSVTVTDAAGCTSEAAVVVDQNPLPVPVITGATTFCAGSSSVLDAGSGYSTYAWSNGGSGQTITVSTSGNYIVTVTDANGCTGETDITVSENTSLMPVITGIPEYCQGGNTVLDAGSGFATYTWTGGSGSQAIQVSSPGTYSVTVSDAIGCTGETSIVVTENALPVVNIQGTSSFCEGENTILSTDGNFVSYNWSDNSSGQTITVDATGTYSVTVTDSAGCTDEASIAITVNALPVPNLTGATSFCEGNSTTIDAGSGYTSYSWSDGSSGQTLEVTQGGAYIVTVTDVNGCTAEEQVDIIENTSLSPQISGVLSFCEGETSLLDAGSGYVTYEWNDGTSNQTLSVDATGSYSVTVSDANGCTGEISVSVSENPLPVVNIQGLNTLCEGETTVLTADGSFANYDWSDNSSGQSITVDATGTYSVIVTDTNGCTDEASISVTVNPLPVPSITGITSFCEGNSTTVDAGSGYTSYSWSDGSSGQTLEVTQGGAYIVTVTDVNGCTAEEQVDIVENTSLNPQISGVLSFCEGETSLLDAGSGYETYEWNDGTLNQTLSVDATGNYSVTVSDTNGCTGEISVAVSENPLPTVNIQGLTAFCDGESTVLTADGSFANYDWSDSSSGQSITVDAAGTYSVIVTDNNGCTGEANINVSLNPNPEPVIGGSTTFCEGGSTSLDAGAGYADYIWSDGSVTQTIEVTAANTLSVTVTDANGCTGEASTTITESTSLNPVISGNPDFCEGENTVLSAGAGFTDYLWSDGSVGQILSVDASGTYSVTVSDNQGCTGETVIDVVENTTPTFAILGNAPFCVGENIELDAGAGFSNYLWSDQSLNQTLTISAAGTYSVIVTDGNGCTAEESIDAIVNDNPEPVILGEAEFCSGAEVTLEVDNNYTIYTWSDGTNDESIMVNTGGTYSVTVSNTFGCTGEAQWTVNQIDNPEPTIVGDLDFCAGESTTLSAPPGFTYEWSNSMSTQDITVNSTGLYTVLVTDNNGCTGTAEVNVVENALPTPVIAGSTTFCTGTTTILDAGTGYSSYSWSDGSFGQTLEVASANDYSVTVTDNNGCTGETQITVTESTSLNPVISGALQLCEGEVSVLDAGAGFLSYIWSNGEVTQTISTALSGDYSVTVSDASGCTGDGSVSLTVNVNPVANISGLDSFCDGENSLLDAGTGYTSYLWTDGSVDQTLLVTATGNYGVTVTDNNGCTATSSLDVIQNQAPLINIVGPSSFCSGNTATLSVPDTYSEYIWSTGEMTSSITLLTGATVAVTVTDGNGCTGETSLTVIENTELSPVISGELAFCDGENTLLDAGTGWATYEWSTGEVTPAITVSNGGNYGVIVTDSDGCSGSTNITVSQNQNPDPIIAGSTTFCTGSSTTLDAGNYSSWLWSTGSIEQSIVTDQPGNYSVIVTDANGCTATADVTVSESSSLNPVISGLPAFCENESTILDAGSGFSNYLWSDGSVNQTLEVNTTGDYSVTVSDASGCSGETTITVDLVLPPESVLQNNSEICNTELSGSVMNLYDLILSGDTNGTWEDLDNSGASGLFDNINFDGVAAGDYGFLYTTSSAIVPCQEVTYPIVVTVIECACGTVTFLPTAPLCNSDGQLDLTTILNTTEPGTWSIISTPAGANPATLNGTVFDAIDANAGEYTLQYQLTNQQPLNCPEVFAQTIIVDQQVSAGVPNNVLSLCEDESILANLSDLISDEDFGGVWTETSAIASQGNAFDAAAGSFNTQGQVAGIYTFQYEVSAALVCPSQMVEVEVEINELPTAIAGLGVELTCANPMNSLNAVGSSSGASYNITWNGPGVVLDGNENTLNPTIDAGGIYELVITNILTGCSSSDEVEVLESSDVPISLAGEDLELTCNILTTTLQPGEDYGSDYLIQWSGPGITAANMNDLNPEVSESGIYTLVVTLIANGCVSSPDAMEVIDNTDDPDIVVETPLSSLDCNTPVIDLISSSPNNNVTFEWTNANGDVLGSNPVLTGVDQDGTYFLTVTNTETGCFSTESVEVINNVSYPFANIDNPPLLDCNNTVITIDGTDSQGGQDIVYTWSGPGISGSNDAPTVEAITPGIYTLVVLNASNGCTAEAMVTLGQNVELPVAVIATPAELDCQVEEVTLDGNGSSASDNFTYQWLDDSNNTIGEDLQLLVESIGLYSLVVTNQDNGCSNTATVEVLQNDNLPQAVLLEMEMPWCAGESNGYVVISDVIGGTAPYTYSFDGSDNSNDNFYPELSAGTYTLALEDANGCQWDTTFQIVDPDPVSLDLGLDITLELGDSAQINAEINIPANVIDTIIWTPADLLTCKNDDCTQVGLNTFNSMLISATVFDLNGCATEDQLLVVMDKERKVFIPSAFSPNNDSNNDVFMIYADITQIKQINYFHIFNRWGEEVFEALDFSPNNEDHGWDGRFKGDFMNPGVFVYIAEIEFIDGHVEQYQGDITLFR